MKIDNLVSMSILFSGLLAHAISEAQVPVTKAPVRIAVAGTTHGHVAWVLGRKKPDVTIVGIYEPNRELAQRLAKQYDLSPTLFYTDLGKMLDAVKPEATVAFGSIFEHLAAVE